MFRNAIKLLGIGLSDAENYEDALSVQEAELSMMRRLGGPEGAILDVQSNLAATYARLDYSEQALRMKRDVYSGCLNLYGEEHVETLRAAFNYATSLVTLERFEEAKALQRKMMPVARRVVGDDHRLTLRMRCSCAMALYEDPAATLDNVREAVTTLEDATRIARRVFGGSHPLTEGIEIDLELSLIHI